MGSIFILRFWWALPNISEFASNGVPHYVGRCSLRAFGDCRVTTGKLTRIVLSPVSDICHV